VLELSLDVTDGPLQQAIDLAQTGETVRIVQRGLVVATIQPYPQPGCSVDRAAHQELKRLAEQAVASVNLLFGEASGDQLQIRRVHRPGGGGR